MIQLSIEIMVKIYINIFIAKHKIQIITFITSSNIFITLLNLYIETYEDNL